MRDDNPEVIAKTKLDEGLNIEWISEYYNDEFEKTGQNLFITGKCEDIYKWIDKQNVDIPKPFKNPIGMGMDDKPIVDHINTENAIKCEYDTKGNLVKLKFFGCVLRTKMKVKGNFSHLELSSGYISSINNSEQTEIVETNYDDYGNRIPSEIIKRIDDYIFFPKARENGEYERVILKDM